VDAMGYLKSKYFEQEGLVTLPLNDGEIILAKHSDRFDYGYGYMLAELSSNIKPGFYKSESNDIRYLIENDGTIRVHRKTVISQEAYLCASNGVMPQIGDEAVGIKNGENNLTVTYDKFIIEVKNGKVSKVKHRFWESL